MNTVTHMTLLDLVQAVNEYAQTDAEVVATVAALINSGKVRLCGNFAGDRSTPYISTPRSRRYRTT